MTFSFAMAPIRRFFGVIGLALVCAACQTANDGRPLTTTGVPLGQSPDQFTDKISTNVGVLLVETDGVARIERGDGNVTQEVLFDNGHRIGFVQFAPVGWFNETTNQNILDRANFDSFLSKTPFRHDLNAVSVEKIETRYIRGHYAQHKGCFAILVAKRLKRPTGWSRDLNAPDTIVKVFSCYTDLTPSEFVNQIGLATDADRREMARRMAKARGEKSVRIQK